MTSTDPSKALLMQHLFWHIVILRRNFEECWKIWPSLSPPCEVDHYSQTAQSCVCLEKTRRLHHQFQEIVLSWVQWISFMTPYTCWSMPCFRHSRLLLSSTPKIAVALRFPFFVHWIMSCLNFAIYDSLLDFWRPSSITTVHDKLE
jgi:hypothetical protein